MELTADEETEETADEETEETEETEEDLDKTLLNLRKKKIKRKSLNSKQIKDLIEKIVGDVINEGNRERLYTCLLYTSDAADE